MNVDQSERVEQMGDDETKINEMGVDQTTVQGNVIYGVRGVFSMGLSSWSENNRTCEALKGKDSWKNIAPRFMTSA